MKQTRLELNWKRENGLIPAIVQDAETGVVLMLGYMNQEALERTLQTNRVWFHSRSRGRLWMKGETSGNTLDLVKVQADCDGDALLVQVSPQGPTCHTGSTSCFRTTKGHDMFNELYAVIAERKEKMPEGSYTASLFARGLNRICEKVGEESGEVIHAAKRESKKRLIEESVDVLYHLFVLLVEKKVEFLEITQEVKRRRGP